MGRRLNDSRGRTGDADEWIRVCGGQATGLTVRHLVVCNRGSATTFSVAMTSRKDEAGGEVADDDYLYYGAALEANETVYVDELNLTLFEGEVLLVKSASGGVTFTAIGR